MRRGARHSSAESRDRRLRRASTWLLTSSSVSPECCGRRGGGVSNELVSPMDPRLGMKLLRGSGV